MLKLGLEQEPPWHHFTQATHDKHATAHATLRQTFTTIPPMTNHVLLCRTWIAIALKPPWQTISPKLLMTVHYTHATHIKPFHPWQTIKLIQPRWTISSMFPITNHCTNVLYVESSDPCYHEKPLQSSTITNHFSHTTHDQTLPSCHHYKPSHPFHPC